MIDLSLIEAGVAEMAAWRHDLHRHPETAFEEFRTAEMVARLLTSFGLEVAGGIGGTGVVGTLRGRGGDGPVVGLRADMDALHVDEQTVVPYQSAHPGRMHACGHDGHMAMLLGAARALASAPDFTGAVRFIFQPAEENEGGGRAMVEAGLFRDFPVDAVFGLHNWPGLPEGGFSLRSGPMLAAYDVFEILLDGQGAHAAMPHLGRDVMVAAAHLVTALQTIVSRSVPPLEAAVVSVTQIHGGDTWNVLPPSVVLRGTVRVFTDPVQDLVERRLRELANGVAATFGMTAGIRYERRYPATVNSPAQARLAARAAVTVVGDDHVVTDIQPSMGSEDFAFMLRERPGCYVWLGAGDCPGLHNPHYDFNDRLLRLGATYWVRLAEAALAPA
jgi:hippurate hydrolase